VEERIEKFKTNPNIEPMEIKKFVAWKWIEWEELYNYVREIYFNI
jgi:hypothetical protein